MTTDWYEILYEGTNNRDDVIAVEPMADGVLVEMDDGVQLLVMVTVMAEPL